MDRLRIAAFLAVAVCVVPRAALAQNTGIAGVVKDASGGVMPGVTVEAASPALIEKVRSVVTNAQGLYSIVDLRPGIYSVTFTLPGFSAVKREGIELTGSFTATVNADLQVGAVEETLTVTGQAPLVDTRNVVQLRVLDDQTRDQLPNGRSILFMALTIPGMTNTGGIRGTGQDVVGASDNRGQSFIHGGRSGDYRMELDGAQLNTTAIQSNPGDTQEYVYELGALSAESDSGGVRANIIPKEGGNRFAGDVFTAFINGSFQSDNLTQKLIDQGIPKPNKILYDRDISASGGGPILRDKLWFFSSYRNFAHKEEVIGMYFAVDPKSFLFDPKLGAAGNVDLNRPGYNEAANYWYNTRLTWQATARNKLAIYWSEQPRHTHGTFVTGTRSMEAGRSQFFNMNRLYQGSYKSPITSRLLLEATATNQHQIGPQGEPDFLPGLASSDIVAVVDSGTGYSYRASPTGYTYTYTHQPSAKAALSYVTGAHASKFGVVYEWGHYFETGLHHTRNMTYQFNNGVPTGITVFNEPYDQRPHYERWGVFAQDQWTLRKLTINAGVRFSTQRGRLGDDQVTGPNAYAPFQRWPAVEDIPNWKDVSPRFGIAYDLFGNGKTAVKYTLSRYVVADTNPGYPNSATVNPIVFNRSATRSWDDRKVCAGGIINDFEPQECELGTLSNSAFGTALTTTRTDLAVQEGWFVRPYDWETSVSVQHQLLPQLSVNVAYTNRWYRNFTATDNEALRPEDYDEFCVTAAPVDQRLGSASGSRICGLFDLNPAKRTVTPNNLVTKAEKFGTQTEGWQGVDVIVNARLPFNATLSGGMNAGPVRNYTKACFVIDSPGVMRFCDVKPVWKTNLRLVGSVELPFGINTGVSFQSIPGPEVLANYTVRNADITAGRVQFLNGRTSFGSGSSTVSLIAPGTRYNERLYQVDVRLSKIVRYRGVRGRLNLDIGNLFNVSTILQNNVTYGTSWLRPDNILPGRIIKPGFAIEF
jgi:hypothetical protein